MLERHLYTLTIDYDCRLLACFQLIAYLFGRRLMHGVKGSSPGSSPCALIRLKLRIHSQEYHCASQPASLELRLAAPDRTSLISGCSDCLPSGGCLTLLKTSLAGLCAFVLLGEVHDGQLYIAF